MGLFDDLSESQAEAVKTIDENLEIIACVEAGKTGVVTRRIINILKLKPDIKPKNIVAFTFTEKAAEELKSRIYKYAKEELGNTTGFADMYIGTIHRFCLNMSQRKIFGSCCGISCRMLCQTNKKNIKLGNLLAVLKKNNIIDTDSTNQQRSCWVLKQ